MYQYQIIANSVNTNGQLPYAILVLLMGILFIGLVIHALLTGKVIENGFVERWRDSRFGYHFVLIGHLGIVIYLIYQGLMLLL